MSKITELWLAFVHWHGWGDFVHWSGWKACARGWNALVHWRGWRAFARWRGWKRLFYPHAVIAILTTLLSIAGLIWIFAGGMEAHPAAYLIYVVSFYALIVVVLRLPKAAQALKALLHRNRMTNRILTDSELRFAGKLYIKQFINFAYGALKTAGGFFYASSWLLTDGLYNLVQGMIELVLILGRKKHRQAEAQWKNYRLCGWLILVLHLFMTGPIFLMIFRDQGETHPEVMVITTAAFAFYKLISAFLGIAKDRAHKAPVDSAVRMISLVQALFSLFSLQISMFHTFGSDFTDQRLMNLLTGSAVSLLVISTGIYMIRRANRELKKL